MRRRYGIVVNDDGTHRMIIAIVTGEMADGTKVWTECDSNRNLINIDDQYTMQTRGGWTEFIRI